MRVEYHPSVRRDFLEVAARYNEVSARLSQDFEVEFRRVVRVAAANPTRFHLVKPGFHRANLRRFPYHVIYRELPDAIRVVLLKHHRRQPEFGSERD